jgi:hypothetical protein
MYVNIHMCTHTYTHMHRVNRRRIQTFLSVPKYSSSLVGLKSDTVSLDFGMLYVEHFHILSSLF